MAFSYYRTLTVDHTKVGSTLTDFTVLISFTHNDLRTVANGGHVRNANGYDIVPFTNATLLTKITGFELARYNASTGELVMWVKIASLSSSVDTVFYLAYGDETISTFQGTAASAWDSNYVAVYHFEDGTTLSVADSTGVNDLVARTSGGSGPPTAAAGKVGGCASFDTAQSQYANKASFSLGGSGDLTVSLWVNSADLDHNGMMVNKEPVNGDWNFFFDDATTSILLRGGGLTAVSASLSGIADNTWHHFVGCISGTLGSIRLNGSEIGEGAVVALTRTTDELVLGRYSGFGGGYYFGGKMDEVRISNVLRSAQWLNTEYNNQNSPSTFMSVGSELPAGLSFPFPKPPMRHLIVR